MLQDTESFYTIAQQKILGRFGKEFTWELKAKMMGQKALPAAQTLVDELGLEGQLKAEDFVKEREEMLHTMFPQAQLLPGVAEFIKHLVSNKVRLSAGPGLRALKITVKYLVGVCFFCSRSRMSRRS